MGSYRLCVKRGEETCEGRRDAGWERERGETERVVEGERRKRGECNTTVVSTYACCHFIHSEMHSLGCILNKSQRPNAGIFSQKAAATLVC